MDDDPRSGEALTANYGWTKPNVGDSDDAWGGMLNADLDGIDSTVKGVSNAAAAAQTTANAALPLAGGTLTGPLVLAADPAAALQPATKQYVDLHSGSVTVSDTAPASPKAGDLWWDSAGGQLYVWYTDPNTSQWVATSSGGAAGSTTLPLMDGTAAAGTGTTWARADHVHPTDTSLYPASNPAGYQTAAQVSASLGGYLSLGGGTVSGGVTFNAVVWSQYGPFTIAHNNATTLQNAAGLSYATANGLIVEQGTIAASFSRVNNPGTLLNFYQTAGYNPGNISVTTTTTTYATSSDVRLKEDERDFDAGPILDRLTVYDFKWTSTGERAHGVMAQEAVRAFPEAVFHDEDDGKDAWFVDYSKFVPLLLREVQALRHRVSELEAAR